MDFSVNFLAVPWSVLGEAYLVAVAVVMWAGRRAVQGLPAMGFRHCPGHILNRGHRPAVLRHEDRLAALARSHVEPASRRQRLGPGDHAHKLGREAPDPTARSRSCASAGTAFSPELIVCALREVDQHMEDGAGQHVSRALEDQAVSKAERRLSSYPGAGGAEEIATRLKPSVRSDMPEAKSE